MPGSALRDSCVRTSGTNPSSRSDRTAASRVNPTAAGAGGSTTGELAATGEGTTGLAVTACGWGPPRVSTTIAATVATTKARKLREKA